MTFKEKRKEYKSQYKRLFSFLLSEGVHMEPQARDKIIGEIWRLCKRIEWIDNFPKNMARKSQIIRHYKVEYQSKININI